MKRKTGKRREREDVSLNILTKLWKLADDVFGPIYRSTNKKLIAPTFFNSKRRWERVYWFWVWDGRYTSNYVLLKSNHILIDFIVTDTKWATCQSRINAGRKYGKVAFASTFRPGTNIIWNRLKKLRPTVSEMINLKSIFRGFINPSNGLVPVSMVQKITEGFLIQTNHAALQQIIFKNLLFEDFF